MRAPSFFDLSEAQALEELAEIGEARVMSRETSQGRVDVIVLASFQNAAQAEAWVDAALPEPVYH